MNNCVKTYAERFALGKCDLYFMRELNKQDKSLVTIEVKNNVVVQSRTKHNNLPTKEQQKFILKTLKKLLNKDYDIPTVVISHAPLFNELNMLSMKSNAYNNDYYCSEPKIEKLFKEHNIIGAIHGHHHIPASSGRSKVVKFAGKEIFVVCSIYSKINTGFELVDLVNSNYQIKEL